MVSEELSQCVRSVLSLGWLDNKLLSLANLLAHCNVTCLCASEPPNHFHCSNNFWNVNHRFSIWGKDIVPGVRERWRTSRVRSLYHKKRLGENQLLRSKEIKKRQTPRREKKCSCNPQKILSKMYFRFWRGLERLKVYRCTSSPLKHFPFVQQCNPVPHTDSLLTRGLSHCESTFC